MGRRVARLARPAAAARRAAIGNGQGVGRARALYKKLQRRYAVFFDDSGNIGKRYRRQDEIGTPWCVTIDFETIEQPGDTFTLRERDSMAQRRITEVELFALLEEHVY